MENSCIGNTYKYRQQVVKEFRRKAAS